MIKNNEPTDDDLISYLLGTVSDEIRLSLVDWLAADPAHGDRLCEFASMVVTVQRFVSDGASPAAGAELTSFDDRILTPRSASRVRRIIALLTLAVSIAFVMLIVRGFRADSSDNRIAMTWADSLPMTIESESNSDVAEWMIEPQTALDSADATVVDDLIADGLSVSEETFGFSSAEPPEWLLTGVLEMQSNDESADAKEVIP